MDKGVNTKLAELRQVCGQRVIMKLVQLRQFRFVDKGVNMKPVQLRQVCEQRGQNETGTAQVGPWTKRSSPVSLVVFRIECRRI